MEARSELRLRLAAAERLIRAADSPDPAERDRLVKAARTMIEVVDSRVSAAAERRYDGRSLLLYLDRSADDRNKDWEQ
jgi:hypothetical protein